MNEAILTKITDLLNKNVDKVYHFCAGTLLAISGFLVGHIFHDPRLNMLLFPIVIGLSKEVYDYFNPPHESSVLDFVATLAGAVPVWLTFFIR
jgi:VanZ family protein